MTDYTATIRTIVPDLEYVAEFVPQSKSRNAGDKQPSLNWRVTFRRGRVELTTDYMQGIGHLPGRDSWAVNQGRKTVSRDRYERECAERGKYGEWQDSIGHIRNARPIPPPDMAEVLHCLILDSEVIEYDSFESWAQEFGYDTDSRKAEATYLACMKTALKLRSMLGDEVIGKVREALQDM